MSNEFLNGLQAASNAVAGNVAGPVDILAFLLRKAGMPVPENAIGGSNWMTQKGLMAPVRQGASQVIGETAGLLGPAMVSQFGPQIARGLLKGGENLAAPRTLNPQTGAVVYHGSPHKFDKFDSSKIGTGEGAQAYGHGLYLADAPGTANFYAETLANKNVVPSQLVSISGKPLNELMAEAPTMARAKVTTYITKANGDMKAAKDALDAFVNEWSVKATPKGKADLLEAQSWMNRLANESPTFIPKPTGNLYKVDLPDEKIASMLDWDAPLSQQAPEVRKAVLATKKQLTPDDIENLGGAAGVRALYDPANKIDNFLGTWQSLRGRPDAGESLLKAQGIPGIRYLDGGSRAQNVVDARLLSMYEKHGGNAEAAVDEFMRGIYNTPKKKAAMREQFLTQLSTRPTRNYVVFPGEESSLRILERNGQGLLGP